MKIRSAVFMVVALLLTGCANRPPKVFVHYVLLPMTPVKNQGKSELCWAYAMLATIETEHILRGDSVNLSPVYVGRKLEDYKNLTSNQRAMCQTALNMIGRHGIVGYDVMPDDATPDLPWFLTGVMGSSTSWTNTFGGRLAHPVSSNATTMKTADRIFIRRQAPV